MLEAVSWRLASELVRRHPRLRIIRTHPGGGQYDSLTIARAEGGPGRLDLNRAGRIQVLERFDDPDAAVREPMEWEAYVAADPHRFLRDLEDALGLPSPAQVPSAAPVTITYRVLAAIAATALKSVRVVDIQPGFIDSSGACGSGPNRLLDRFTAVPIELRQPKATDQEGEPGYRFWIVVRAGQPQIAHEQEAGMAWTTTGEAVDLMASYRRSGRKLAVVALDLLRLVEG